MKRLLTYLLWSFTFICGCTEPSDNLNPTPSDKVEIQLSLSMISTRSPGEQETKVNDIMLLVFNDVQKNGSYTYGYKQAGIIKEEDGEMTVRATLERSGFPVKIAMIANAGSALDDAYSTLDNGYTEAEAIAALTLPFTPTSYDDGDNFLLPMYGECTFPRLVATRVTGTVKLLRAVSKIQVEKNLVEESAPFVMNSLYVFRANNLIQVMPSLNNRITTLEENPSVNNPSVPVGTTPYSSENDVDAVKRIDTDVSLFDHIYLPESASPTGDEIPVVLVVGGLYDDDIVETFYRIDFDVKGTEYGQLLRNFIYHFSITQVTGQGKANAVDAANAAPAGIIVNVSEWADSGLPPIIYVPGGYIGLPSTKINMPFLPGYQRELEMQITIQGGYEIEWVTNGVPTGVRYEAGSDATYIESGLETDGVTSGRFHAVATAVDAEDKSTIRIATPKKTEFYNKSNSEITQHALRIYANGVTAEIAVTQESPHTYADRKINVESNTTYDYGNLGYTTGGVRYVPDATRAMRYILDSPANYSTSGTFGFGGFNFSLNTYTTNNATPEYINPSVATSLPVDLKDIDIFVLSYTNIISVSAADWLHNTWLPGGNRIVWAFRDNDGTNINFFNTYAARDGQWGYGGTAPTAFHVADEQLLDTEKLIYEASLITNGPFGHIDHERKYHITDATSSYVNLTAENKKNVTPLVYRDGDITKVKLAVNMAKGIIYCGDSEFFQGSAVRPLSYAAYLDGTIDYDTAGELHHMDRLMANLWAWMVGYVIYGPANYNVYS
ncbi:MAG: hypothetical protein LBM62_06280 [Mediterranea sp.]|jgi:hypothetical protein|nr:hypothetical protein [Mediterranea sp.]